MVGWIGNVFIVAGLWGIGNQRRQAVLFSVLGESLYIYRSYLVRDWALFGICSVFLLMAVRCYVLWGKS